MSQTDAFKVCVRIRPLNQKEQDLQINQRRRITFKEVNQNETICLIDCPSQSVLAIEGQIEQKSFYFDNVYGEESTTQNLFKGQIQSMLVDSISQGYNATIFAYGMTGAGKSYTMFGDLYNEDSTFSTSYQQGIISLCVEQIFKDQNVQSIGMTFLEIYNEHLRDLICQTQGTSLPIVDDPLKGVVVQDAQEIQVQSNEQVRQLVQNGNQRRVMAATQANTVSSRSHAILQFFIVTEKYTTKVSLVDLAGSERASVSENKGIRLQEGANINRSLLALGNCINVLAEASKNNKKVNFVPYRDSKLTRLLKDSLGGNTRTIMIGCVSPSLHCHEETINTLKYASRARAIKKRIIQNIKSVGEYNEQGIILNLQQEVMKLRQQLDDQQKNQILKIPPSNMIEQNNELRASLQQIDDIQQQNEQELKEQILYLQNIEEFLSTQDEDLSSPLKEEQARIEYDKIIYGIQDLEKQIEENNLVRINLQNQINLNSLQQNKYEVLSPRTVQEDPRDKLILQMQKEMEKMRYKLCEKNDLIQLLRLKQKPQVSINTNTHNSSLDNEATLRSVFQKSRSPDELSEVSKQLFVSSLMQTQTHEISIDIESQSRVILTDITEEPTNIENNAQNSRIRESRKVSCTPQLYPYQSKQDKMIDNIRQTMSARKSPEKENSQFNLVQLNKARDDYKNYRTRLYQLKEQLQLCVQNGQSLCQEQMELVIALLQDLQENKYKISSQDQQIITIFQKLTEKYQQRSNVFVQPNRSQLNHPSRSKSANFTRKKDSASINQQKVQVKKVQNNWNITQQDVSPRANLNRRLNPQGGMSNSNRNYAQMVQRAKKQSINKLKDSGISQLLQQQGVLRNRIQYGNENNIYIQKPVQKYVQQA